MYWNDKPYHSFDYEMKKRFGKKMYRLSLDGGMTCPNRDGTVGVGGCIFCSAGGSGDFAAKKTHDVDLQLEDAKHRIESKVSGKEHGFIAYFQSYTNTYDTVDNLKKLFIPVAQNPDIEAFSIATRPDCLSRDVLELLSEINRIKPVWVELGLQTIHEDTAKYINRGYSLDVFDQSITNLQKSGLETIVHVILGLPTEDRQDMLDTVRYVAKTNVAGIKLALLHVLNNTKLYEIYKEKPFHIMKMEEYIDILIDCISILPKDMVIHRLTGDGPKKDLIAPLWSADKKKVLNTLHKRFAERKVTQGVGIS